jgi:thiol-disulfide isomerase/thioredoxin
MKICTKCKKDKLLINFSKATNRSGGYASWCKPCYAEAAALKYQTSLDERERKKRNRANLRKVNQTLILKYLSNSECVDCGEKDVRVLEFDHMDIATKNYNVANMYASHSWENILAEIEKCEIRCANHHRIKTAEQFGTWRSLIEKM